MKTWNILNNSKKVTKDDLITVLLKNRGINTKNGIDYFLNPKLSDVTAEKTGIDKKELEKAIKRIKKAIEAQEQIVVFGDYDVDGITGAAIIWETIHALGGKVIPYIPHRIDEGYGLSIRGIENIKDQKSNLKDTSLIITDDNGIVANEAVEYANEHEIDVIITDHHVPSKELPKAHSIVHTTQLCGAGVAYLLSQEIKNLHSTSSGQATSKIKNDQEDTHLELAALGTIADMVPLTSANRTIVKHGLSRISNTKRVGLQELFKQAGLEKENFTPYEIGYIIAPRLNAAGRIDSAMDSLRLLCTNDRKRAHDLAVKLELINKERQLVLKEATEHAIATVKNLETKVKNLLFVAHESYQQGVIGLVAGKLVEEFYRPSIVLSIGEKQTKASARSISGFNMIEFLRLHTAQFINVGGHPMAAGFSIATENLEALKKLLEKSADELMTPEISERKLKIDCEIQLSLISPVLYNDIQILSPFGMGNPEPVFVSREVTIKDFKLLGKDRTHLKLSLKQEDSQIFEAIGFGLSDFAENLKPGDKIDIAYTIDENVWNGNTKIQLKVKDIKKDDK